MKKSLVISFLIFSFILGLIACEGDKKSVQSDENSELEVLQTDSVPGAFGEAVDVDFAISLAELESQMNGKRLLEEVTVKGKVTDVCQKKGCWMKLEKNDGETIRVTFKDYALFMPKDIVGKEVIMRGKAMTDTTSVDDLKHFAEDAGKSEEEIATITEPEIALAFEADGVLINN